MAQLSRRSYLPSRAIATGLSLGLAFYYSKDLGVVNRSFVAVIMTASILSIAACVSGSTLTLRTIKLNSMDINLRASFKSLVLLQGLLALALYLLAILSFSVFKDPLPVQLLLVSVVYFVFSFLHLLFLELVIAAGDFRKAGKLEILTVVLQIVSYFSGSLFDEISKASRLLFSFSFSYLVVIALAWRITNFNLFTRLGSPIPFSSLTKGKNSIGATLAILDRIDRLLIAWLLPTSNLGKYSVMSSFFTYFRFFPDAISKIIVAGPLKTKSGLLSKKLFLFLSFVALATAILFGSRKFIEIYLGKIWLLPLTVSILFMFQEVSRGYYQVFQNRILAKNLGESNHFPIVILISIILLSILLVSLIGLTGVPLAFTICYLSGILVMHLKEKDV